MKRKQNKIDGCSIESVFISPLNYNLICEDAPAYENEPRELSGYIDADTLTIHIKSSLPYERKSVTILHEILHGMLMHSGLNIKEKDDDFFETIIESLSHSLFSLIRTNPDLIEYLQQTD